MEAIIGFAVLAVGVVVAIILMPSKPSSASPPGSAGDDVVLGTFSPHLPMNRIKLGQTEQSYAAAIFGRSGSGKSRMLESIFLQHLNADRGVGIVEPHHDLSFDTLSYLVANGYFKNPDAYKKLVYIDWGNGAFVPFNVLDQPWDEDTIAEKALDAMLRVWPELKEAPLFQTLFLSSIAALSVNHLPITFLYRLLSDTNFRNECLRKVASPLIHQTFQNFDGLGRSQVEAAGSTLRRGFLLSFSKVANLTLGQPENWLPFRQWMDAGTSFILNLGNINDSQTRELIGAMLMVQIEQAALSRTDLPPSQRTPFTLLVDEWPSFAAQERTISHILSQCRKFNLRLYLSAQSLAQVDSTRLAGALENCKLQVAFGLGRDSAVTQARHIATIDPMKVKEAALTETQHNQYVSVLEQFEEWTQELQNLEPRFAYVKLEGKPAVCIKTIGMPDAEPDPAELADVLSQYRRMYQRTQDEAEAAIASLLSPAASSSPNGSTKWKPHYTRTFQP